VEVEHRVLPRLEARGGRPDQLGELLRGRLVFGTWRRGRQVELVVDRLGAPGAGHVVAGQVVRDPVQPAPDEGGLAQRLPSLPGPDEGQLGQILGRGGIAQEARKEIVEARQMAVVEGAKGRLVAVAKCPYKVGVVVAAALPFRDIRNLDPTPTGRLRPEISSREVEVGPSASPIQPWAGQCGQGAGQRWPH
jgi:hypothetical protein